MVKFKAEFFALVTLALAFVGCQDDPRYQVGETLEVSGTDGGFVEIAEIRDCSLDSTRYKYITSPASAKDLVSYVKGTHAIEESVFLRSAKSDEAVEAFVRGQQEDVAEFDSVVVSVDGSEANSASCVWFRIVDPPSPIRHGVMSADLLAERIEEGQPVRLGALAILFKEVEPDL